MKRILSTIGIAGAALALSLAVFGASPAAAAPVETGQNACYSYYSYSTFGAVANCSSYVGYTYPTYSYSYTGSYLPYYYSYAPTYRTVSTIPSYYYTTPTVSTVLPSYYYTVPTTSAVVSNYTGYVPSSYYYTGYAGYPGYTYFSYVR